MKPSAESQGISRKAMTTWRRIGPISIETIIKANKEHGMPDIEFESDKVIFNKWTDVNGRLFEGQQNLKTKKADGIAKAYWDLGMFEGQCKSSEPHGFGRLINQHGMYYVGFFNMGERSGFGTEYNPDGSVFLKGTWKMNEYNPDSYFDTPKSKK